MGVVLAQSGSGGNGGTPSGLSTVGVSQDPGLGDGASAPGKPVVTPLRQTPTTVLFTWTYANEAPGVDTFQWQKVNANDAEVHEVPTASVTVTTAADAMVCIHVKVLGSRALSEWSESKCA